MAFIKKIYKNRKQKGYTVLEVMIVLSVSALLFTAAIIGYSRQNSRAQFENAIREMEVTIRDVLNDVSTGYYPSSNNFSCRREGSPAFPQIDPSGAADQGTNEDCIFIGKAALFNPGLFEVGTIVGLRNKSTDNESLSTNVNEAENRLITLPGTFDTHPVHASLDITRIVSGDMVFSHGGFAVVSGFGHGEKGGAGATSNQVIVSRLSPSGDRVVDNDDLINRDVTICIAETGGGRQASIKIGSGARNNVVTNIDPWVEECN